MKTDVRVLLLVQHLQNKCVKHPTGKDVELLMLAEQANMVDTYCIEHKLPITYIGYCGRKDIPTYHCFSVAKDLATLTERERER